MRARDFVAIAFVALSAIAEASCGQGARPPARSGHTRFTRSQWPAREEGCAITSFANAPPGKTENIGGVSASCTPDTPDADCLRTLDDQACALGADVLWGVSPPELRDGRKRASGRAAHTMP